MDSANPMMTHHSQSRSILETSAMAIAITKHEYFYSCFRISGTITWDEKQHVQIKISLLANVLLYDDGPLGA